MNWNEIPSLNALRAFEAAARLGTFSEAARELNVTHAAIAQHVRHLEDHFGTSLLQRNGRKMDVTSEGAELANGLGKAFQQIATSTQKLSTRSEKAALRITTTPAFASLWLMPRVGLFWQDHPDIEIEIIPTDKVVDMRSEDIDLAIRYGDGNWPGLEADHLMAAGYVAVAHPDYPFKDGDDIRNHNLFTYGTNQSEAVRWLGSQGFDLKEEDFTFAPDAQLIRQAALSKRGVAILTTPVVSDDIANGNLRTVTKKISEEHAYYIVSRPKVVNKNRDIFKKWLLRERAKEPVI